MNKKALIVLLVAIVWGIGCWWWYVHKIKGKQGAVASTTVIQPGKPLLFRISSDTPIMGTTFQAFKDSIIASVGKNNLQITGLYFSDEKNSTSSPDLGTARANKIKDLFKDKIAESQLIIKSEADTFKYPAGKPDAFEGVQFLIVTAATLHPVQENNNNTITIYLPTKKIDPAVDDQLKELVAKLKSSKRTTLIVTGYSDNKGASKSNYNAGLKRANAIKHELIKYGFSAKRITAKSEGDKDPVASNDTDEGRQKNRRVEITINNQ